MTIAHEATRLFLAVTALILVGMLSNPMGGDFIRQPQSTISTSTEKAETPKAAPKKHEETTTRVAQIKKKNQFPIRTGGRWVLLPANNKVGTVALRK